MIGTLLTVQTKNIGKIELKESCKANPSTADKEVNQQDC